MHSICVHLHFLEYITVCVNTNFYRHLQSYIISYIHVVRAAATSPQSLLMHSLLGFAPEQNSPLFKLVYILKPFNMHCTHTHTLAHTAIAGTRTRTHILTLLLLLYAYIGYSTHKHRISSLSLSLPPHLLCPPADCPFFYTANIKNEQNYL